MNCQYSRAFNSLMESKVITIKKTKNYQARVAHHTKGSFTLSTSVRGK